MSETTSEVSVKPPDAPAPGNPAEDEARTLRATQDALAKTGRAVSSSFDKARGIIQSPAFNPFGGARLVLTLLAWDRHLIPAALIETILRVAERTGHWGIVVAQILSAFFCLAAAVKMSEWKYVGYAAAVVVLLAVLQFLAERFLAQNRQAVETTPVRLNSPGLPDAVALVAEFAGIALFVTYLVQARAYSQWSLAGIGLVLWVLLDLFAHLALNPPSVNLSIAPGAGAGDEALGILGFFANALLRLTSAAFAVGAIAGDVYLIAAFFPLLQSMSPEPGMAAVRLIALSAAAPLLAYLAFVVCRLGIDLIQACLDTPRRLAGGSARKEH